MNSTIYVCVLSYINNYLMKLYTDCLFFVQNENKKRKNIKNIQFFLSLKSL